MKTTLHLLSDKSWLVASLLLVLGSTQSIAAITPLYGGDATGAEVRFGGTIGGGSSWTPLTPQASAGVSYNGRVALTCSGLDYGGFLKGFKPSEYLTEIKNQFITGAQSAVTNYLIVTAYSNPTLASVLDTVNQGYSAKFNLFQSACNAQESKQRGMELGARRMAESQNQCYEDQVKTGASPTEAYQLCANETTFGPIASKLPAGKSTLDFLKGYTNVNVTKEVETLLGLLGDERVTDAGLEMRAPKITMHDLNANIESRAGNAIDAVLNGASPATIPDCNLDDYLSSTPITTAACLPPPVAGVVQSTAFLSARQLSPEAKKLYKDALGSQLAITTIRGAILDLMSQIKQMDVKSGAGAHASEVIQRKKTLEEQVTTMQKEADAFQSFQQAKASATRTQILAMDMVNKNIATTENAKTPRRANTLSFDAIKTLFAK